MGASLPFFPYTTTTLTTTSTPRFSFPTNPYKSGLDLLLIAIGSGVLARRCLTPIKDVCCKGRVGCERGVLPHPRSPTLWLLERKRYPYLCQDRATMLNSERRPRHTTERPSHNSWEAYSACSAHIWPCINIIFKCPKGVLNELGHLHPRHNKHADGLLNR